MSVRLVFESPIPIPESEALIQAPVRWRLGLIPMRTPLFSLGLYQLFTKLTNGIRLYMASTGSFTLERLLNMEGEEEQKIAGRMLAEACETYKEKTGIIPKDLCELLIAVSWPLNLSQAIGIVGEWVENYGVGKVEIDEWEFPKDELDALKNPLPFRKALSEYMLWNCDVSDLVLTLQNVTKIQTEIKKKLENWPSKEETDDFKGHWNRNLLRTRRMLSQAKMESGKSR